MLCKETRKRDTANSRKRTKNDSTKKASSPYITEKNYGKRPITEDFAESSKKNSITEDPLNFTEGPPEKRPATEDSLERRSDSTSSIEGNYIIECIYIRNDP